MLIDKIVCLLAFVLTVTRTVEGCPCTCGGGTTEISTMSLLDLLACLFDADYEETNLLKYDRSSDEWVSTCPELENCLYGVDEGDEDICPSCYHGPGDVCGPWIGFCDVTSDLVCQYNSDYAAQGVCVSFDDYTHKQLGENCGDYEGMCDEGLHCLFMTEYYDGEAGMCVKNEDFFTGELGDNCNQRTMGCKDDLVCNESYFLASTCQEPTNQTSAILDFLIEADDGFGGLNEFEIIVEIDDETLLEDDEFLDELLFEVEEMVYMEALLTMDDDGVFETIQFMTEDITDSFLGDFMTWDDASTSYGANFDEWDVLDGDDKSLDIDEDDFQNTFDENKVHVVHSDGDFDISDDDVREFAVKKEFCVL